MSSYILKGIGIIFMVSILSQVISAQSNDLSQDTQAPLTINSIQGQGVRTTSNCVTAYTDGKTPSVILSRGSSSANIDASNTNTKIVMGGVLNTKALSKVTPDYPRMAKNSRVQGAVSVDVIIDVTGKVVSGCVVSGHPLLRAASIHAAMQWQFSPTRLSGEPVAVKGFIVFNFRLEEPILPTLSASPSISTHKP